MTVALFNRDLGERGNLPLLNSSTIGIPGQKYPLQMKKLYHLLFQQYYFNFEILSVYCFYFQLPFSCKNFPPLEYFFEKTENAYIYN